MHHKQSTMSDKSGTIFFFLQIDSMAAAATAKRNILLVGMVSHTKEDALASNTSMRDQERINVLRDQFGAVFTISKSADTYDTTSHVIGTMSQSGAKSIMKILNESIDYICLDYVRFPTTYYYSFV